MAKVPYMRWYPADYAGDTTHLTRDQDGGYRLLLDAMWLRDGKLPDDDAQLAVITKCSTQAEWQVLRKILSPFFKILHGKWTQKRLTRERREAQHLQQARVNAGKKGAEHRWQTHTEGNSKTMARARVPEPYPEPEDSPSPLYPPSPPGGGSGRERKSTRSSPRMIQAQAFWEIANERTRNRNC